MDRSGGASGAIGRPTKATADAVAKAAWDLFEERGFEATTMSDVAVRAGISRRTLFNYFGSKEALLFPGLAQYFETLERELLARPRDERFLDSVDHCLGTLQPRLDDVVRMRKPGPAVVAAQTSPEASTYLRDYAAQTLRSTALKRFAGDGGREIKAGLVAAIGAQVWVETAGVVRQRGESLPESDALHVVLGHLRDLLR